MPFRVSQHVMRTARQREAGPRRDPPSLTCCASTLTIHTLPHTLRRQVYIFFLFCQGGRICLFLFSHMQVLFFPFAPNSGGIEATELPRFRLVEWHDGVPRTDCASHAPSAHLFLLHRKKKKVGQICVLDTLDNDFFFQR